MTLYELAQDMRDLYDALDNCETIEEQDALIDQAIVVGGNLRDKAEGYYRLMRTLTKEAEDMGEEIKRFQARKTRRENAVERLKARMLRAMQATNLEKIETPLGNWSRRMSPWSVTVEDESLIDARFRIPQPDKIDKKAILEEFKKTGEALQGCEYTQHEYVMFR